MERLVTTSEATQILGLSLQGVHYRIKNGQLKSLKQGGKTFVYVTDFFKDKIIEQNSQESLKIEPFCQKTQKILDAKDDQISFLKETLLSIKNQYKDEIQRLENSQRRVVKVFKSEIELLKSAFNEMRTIYKTKDLKLQNKNDSKYVTMEQFLQYFKEYGKTNNDIKQIILNSIKIGDERFLYNKNTKKLLILNADYSDLV